MKRAFACLALAAGALVLTVPRAAVAQDAPPEVPAPQEPSTGNWEFDVTISPVDGRQRVTAVLASRQQVTNSIGSPEPAFLVLRCQGRELAAYVTWPFFVASDHAAVVFTLGISSPRAETWFASNDGTSVGYFDTRRARNLITRLSTERRMAIRVIPRFGSPRETVFAMAGIDVVAAEVLKSCGQAPRS